MDSIVLNDKIRVEGGRRGRQEYIPAILFMKLVTHDLGQLRFIMRTSVEERPFSVDQKLE
jgi:hypothetical protein